MLLFSIEGHEALDRNPGPGYNTLLVIGISSACPHEQFHALPSFKTIELHCPTQKYAYQAPRQFIPFYDGRWYDPAGARTADLRHEANTLTTKLTGRSVHTLHQHYSHGYLASMIFGENLKGRNQLRAVYKYILYL